MVRFEVKYLVPDKFKNSLREEMLRYLKHDYYSEVRPLNEYTVRSIYLDTPELTSYYEKLSGIKIRNKFRIRGYNRLTQDSYVFFEIKRKDGVYVSKDRAPVCYTSMNDFINFSDLSKVENHSIEYDKRIRSAENFIFYLKRDRLKPIINVVYEREALEYKLGSNLRITFDTNIRSFLTEDIDDLFKEKDMKILYPSNFVLEVKYNKVLPSWVPLIINKYNLNKEAVSKYAFCLNMYIKDKILIRSI